MSGALGANPRDALARLVGVDTRDVPGGRGTAPTENFSLRIEEFEVHGKIRGGGLEEEHVSRPSRGFPVPAETELRPSLSLRPEGEPAFSDDGHETAVEIAIRETLARFRRKLKNRRRAVGHVHYEINRP